MRVLPWILEHVIPQNGDIMSRLSIADWVHLRGVEETYPFALLVYAAREFGTGGLAKGRG
jgi:hypothetical protein